MNESPNIVSKIGLNKLFLWMEAERLESYPEAFARLEAGRKYTRQELVKEVFGLIYNEKATSNRPVRSDFMQNLFGLEVHSPNKVLIRGINALRKIEPEIFTPTSIALEIGQAYRKGDETAWLQGLAKMIARYEVRTRLMLYLLGKGGFRLVFPKEGFFGIGSNHAELLHFENRIPLFAQDAKEFNALLQEHRAIALGRWWMDLIHAEGMDIAPDFIFEGLKKPRPPINKLSDRLKISLFLMKHLGILENQAGEWVVNEPRTLEILGPEIAQDFIKVEEISFSLNPLDWIKEWQKSAQDEAGFIVVSVLVRQWAERNQISISQAEIELDNWMREQTYYGHIQIIEMNQGQPRHGRGLYGNDSARKIKFEIIESQGVKK